MAFRSKPENCVLDPHAFAPLRPGWKYTAIPLLDASEVLSDGATPICAQLTYAGAKAALARFGLQMLTPSDLEYLHAEAVAGRGVELPAFTGTPTAETDLPNRRKSDEANRAAAKRLGWRPGDRIANFGKGWVDADDGEPPVPAGRARLMGWHVPELARYTPPRGQKGHRSGPGFIQPRPAPGSAGAHGEHDQADDGTNAWGKCRDDGIDTNADTDPPPGSADWAGAVTGALRAALEPSVGAIRAAIERGGHVLPSTSTEPAAGHVLAASGEIAPPLALQGPGRLPASLAPHGYRCSVAEQIADARILGTWHDVSSGYVPQVGDLACSRRAGGDPRTGGLGHVERVSRIVNRADGGAVWSIGGNENDGYVEAPLDLRNVIGWIEYPPALGARCVELARLELAAGVRERPGAASHPRIQEYHAGARRGGGPRAGMPGYEREGVAVLGPKAEDSVAWCASSASWCCAMALRLP